MPATSVPLDAAAGPLVSTEPLVSTQSLISTEPLVSTEPLSVFFDGDCPLCTREIQMISGRDRLGRIRFVDIAGSTFRAETLGLTQADLMAEIHAQLPDGTLIKGVEVFRQMYARLGFTRLVQMSRWWGIRHALRAVYSLWARNRLRLTGRCTDDVCLTSKSS